MSEATTYVGMDVHKKDIAVCLLSGDGKEAQEWTVAHTKQSVNRLIRRLKRARGSDVESAYEAGPCGYAPMRQFQAAGVGCQVVAPSLVPVRPGDRIKTDRRDARKLAEMLCAGLLVEVHPPTEEEESLRDLCRCREDLKQNLMRARHRLGKMLLRRGLVYRDGSNWTLRHREWLQKLHFERDMDRFVFGEYLAGVEIVEARIFAVEQKLVEVSESEPWAERAGWLRCFRGIDTVTAMTIVAELHDFRRFHSAPQLMC